MSDDATTIPPWPGENPEGPWGAEAVMRYFAAEGLHRAARSIDLLPDLGDQVGEYRYFLNVERLQHSHDLYLALDALRQLDPAKADEIADRTTLAAVAGDSYHEWLWQWADDHGLDADGISAESRASIARELEEAPDGRDND